MKKAKAVVFDIDGTLSPDISWLALTRDLGAPVEQHVQIYSDYKEGKTDYITSKEQLIGIWRATGNANKDFFDRVFGTLPVNPVAERIVQIAKTGRIVCVITGSMDLYAQTVARKLGIDQWYANTTLHWDSKNNLYDMDYELNQADKKLEQFTQFCEVNELDAQDCIVLGDGENDEKLFEVCKRGVLIGTDPESETFAWKRIAGLAEFERILQKH